MTVARPDSPRSRSKRVAGPSVSAPVVLPASGREGDPPPWPLSRPSAAQLARWTLLWASPQAVQWERIGCVEVVASYVVTSLRADRTGKGTDVSSAGRLATALGRTPAGMARLRWVIGEPAEAAMEATVLSVVREPRRLVVDD